MIEQTPSRTCGEEATLQQVCWQNLTPQNGHTLEQLIKDYKGLQPVEGFKMEKLIEHSKRSM